MLSAILGACLASSAIRLSLVETLSGPEVPGVFPSRGSMLELSFTTMGQPPMIPKGARGARPAIRPGDASEDVTIVVRPTIVAEGVRAADLLPAPQVAAQLL